MKHPKNMKTVTIAVSVADMECATVKVSVMSMFYYLQGGFGDQMSMSSGREKAWRYARWKYDVDTSNFNDILPFIPPIEYNSDLASDGETDTRTNTCDLGPSAFTSENLCTSTLLHENVHGGQSRAFRIRSYLAFEFPPRTGAHIAEVQAYGAEIDNAERTGLSEDELNEVIALWRYYGLQGPKP